MAKSTSLPALLLVVAALTLYGGEEIWIPKTHSWSGNGIRLTELIPVHGRIFRLRCSTKDSGKLKITAENEDGTGGIVILDRQRLERTTSAKFTARKANMRLRIEGDADGWNVEMDQFMDSVQEWRYRRYMAEKKNAALRKIGVWAQQGPAGISMDIPRTPCRLRLNAESGGGLLLTVRNSEGLVILQAYPEKDGRTAGGFIYTGGKIDIDVSAAPETPWLLETFCE